MAGVALYDIRPVKTVRIEQENFINTSFETGKRISLIEETLPFRIKFTAIMVPGYGPNNVPPIPLQIIGYSNYIL
jgi:hypothetical protein